MGENDNPVAAAIFDLDGTLTLTVDLHETNWKDAFDTFFWTRLQRFGERHRPFDTADYRAYVDGRPRPDGVRALLRSRGIGLPDGSDHDSPGYETVMSIANRNRELFLDRLDRLGAAPDVDALRLLNGLRAMGAGIALASADEDAERILEHAGLSVDLFDIALYAELGQRQKLAPKPRPDVFHECLEQLEVMHPERAVVFDDSIVGVAAAREAGIGLVIGIDRGGNASALRIHGADWVVQGLHEVAILQIADHFLRPAPRT